MVVSTAQLQMISHARVEGSVTKAWPIMVFPDILLMIMNLPCRLSRYCSLRLAPTASVSRSLSLGRADSCSPPNTPSLALSLLSAVSQPGDHSLAT